MWHVAFHKRKTTNINFDGAHSALWARDCVRGGWTHIYIDIYIYIRVFSSVPTSKAYLRSHSYDAGIDGLPSQLDSRLEHELVDVQCAAIVMAKC
jgi:hypothetical protein